MDRSTVSFPAYRSPGYVQTLSDAFVEVATMLFGSATFEPHRSFEAETREMVAPHLAILIHKRDRFLTPDVNGAVLGERWTAELNGFVERSFFWPTPLPNDAPSRMDRQHLVKLVDRIVIDEQRGTAAQGTALPQTSRFGSSWAD